MGEAEAEDFGGGSLRIGVIGVGVMGSNHARVLAELPGVKLVGVADPDRKRSDQVARSLGCASFTDAEGLIRRGVDAVTVQDIIKVLTANAEKAARLVVRLAREFPREHEPCPIGCDRALDNALITAPKARDPKLLKKLDAVAGRVLRRK